jgi:hypothetical protein
VLFSVFFCLLQVLDRQLLNSFDVEDWLDEVFEYFRLVLVLQLLLQLKDAQLQVCVRAGTVGTIFAAKVSKVRELLVQRLLDRVQIEAGELADTLKPRLVDREPLPNHFIELSQLRVIVHAVARL